MVSENDVALHRASERPVAAAPKTAVLTSLSGLSFDDVLILPERTGLIPKEVATDTHIARGLRADLPVLAAPMMSVWSVELTCALAEWGAAAPVAREVNGADLTKALEAIKKHRIDLKKYARALHRSERPVVIVSSSPFDEGRIDSLLRSPLVDYVLLETVQPYNDRVFELLTSLGDSACRKILVGNIATVEAAWEFAKYPVAALKVGLGAGSICTTRSVLGIGVPQLQAIEEVCKVARKADIPVIADGGIRHLSDIPKAIAAGAQSVMMGRLFAGTREAPGTIEIHDEKEYKLYAGESYASLEVASLEDQDILEELQQLKKKNHRVEGVTGYIAYTGSAKLLLWHVKKALQNALSFTGAQNLEDFQARARFIRVSAEAHREGSAHSIDKITHRNHFF